MLNGSDQRCVVEPGKKEVRERVKRSWASVSALDPTQVMLPPTCHKETLKKRLPGCEGSADADLIGWGGMFGGWKWLRVIKRRCVLSSFKVEVIFCVLASILQDSLKGRETFD